MINSFKNYLVEEEKTVYVTFGRMNPPTIGHEKLMNTMAKKSGKNPYRIYLSKSEDKKKNPLPFKTKVKLARKMFPKHARQIMGDPSIRTIIDAVVKLYNEGFKRVVLVVGSDRVKEFDVLLNKYNGQKARHGFYNFERINVISAGDRDPDADGAEGMSASKMRDAATKNDFTAFSQGLPKTVSNADAKNIYNTLRNAMGLKEEREFKRHIQLEPVSEIRENYISGELFNIGDKIIIKETGEITKVKHLGSNYVILEDSKRKWLDDVEKIDEMSALAKLMQKIRLSPKMDRLVRGYLNFRRDNPGKGRQGVIKFVQRLGPSYNLRDADEIIKAMNNLVKQGKLPKHLAIAEEKKKKDIGPTKGQDPDIKDMKGTQPAPYYKGLKVSTKKSRHSQFKKQSKMSDDNPAAYKPAPGDAKAKTKPSVHTKKFKQMFGDD